MNSDEGFLPGWKRWESNKVIFCKLTTASAPGPTAALINW